MIHKYFKYKDKYIKYKNQHGGICIHEIKDDTDLNKTMLDSLSKKIVIMHPGPINRGVEITSDVADGSQSIILDQVENGVAVRMAVMFLLAGK